MKKLVTLLAAAGMVVAASAPANAVDVKVDYRYRFSYDVKSQGFTGTNMEEAKQRFRLGLTMAASENLSGYIQFQTGKDAFGTCDKNFGKSSSMTTVRQMYIDWTVPATDVKVRMGRQLMGFPAEALGYNAVMDAGYGSRDGIVVAAPVTDWLSVTALWNRAAHETWDAGTSADKEDDYDDLANNKSLDVFGVIFDTKFDAANASVYAAYANVDSYKTNCGGIADLGGEATAYWVGATATLKAFDPFTFALSFAYGSAELDDQYGKGEQQGWEVQAKASYKLGFGTPFLGAWYASGYDADDVVNKGELGIMPSVGGYIAPTRTYHDAAGSLNGGQGYYLPAGNWGITAGIEGVSFLQNLSHDFIVTYLQGTNKNNAASNAYVNAEGLATQYLDEDDSFVAFDLVSTYKIYKNLAAKLELSYMINDFDSELNKTRDEDDWRAGLTFDFKF